MMIFCLSGCRYWSLYKFGDQFCDFDEHVDLRVQADALKIKFLNPVLPRKVLLRYLNAAPIHSFYAQRSYTEASYIASAYIQSSEYIFERIEDKGVITQDVFRIQDLSGEARKSFELSMAYHAVGSTPVLKSAELDDRLSQLFGPALIESILRSICSDDYDLSLSRLDMRFKLKAVPTLTLPNRNSLLAVFGQAERIENDSQTETLFYTFDFIKATVSEPEERGEFQLRPIYFSFTLDDKQQLLKLHILYYKYDYVLDFEKQNGRLIVIRS